MHNPSLIRVPRARLVMLLAVILSIANAQVNQDAGSESWIRHYEPHADGEMPYRLMGPMAFDEGKLYPVIVSLHGGGGRGADNRKQLRAWNRLLADEELRKQYPSYVLAPQTTRLWDAAHLEKIKSIVAALPAADQGRVYVLGHSMGGHGSFILLQIDPGYFHLLQNPPGNSRRAAPARGAGPRPRRAIHRRVPDQGRTDLGISRRSRHGCPLRACGGVVRRDEATWRQHEADDLDWGCPRCRSKDDCRRRQRQHQVQQRSLRHRTRDAAVALLPFAVFQALSTPLEPRG